MSRLPTSRCAGVRGSSKSSTEMYVSGLELRTISISTKAVSSSSWENLDRPKAFLRQRLVDHTSRSNKPPHHGALGTLNFHSMPTPSKYLWTSELETTLLITFAAATNVWPLSDTIRAGKPLLELNLLKLRIKVEADKSGTRSKCMALVMQHACTVQPTPWIDFHQETWYTRVQQNQHHC